MASSGTHFEKIRMLSHLKSDEDVLNFIREIRKYSSQDLKYKVIAAVMSQPNAQCHNTQWIAIEALRTLKFETSRNQTFDTCPICFAQLPNGRLKEHLVKLHMESKLRELNEDTILNLLYYLQHNTQLVNRLASRAGVPIPIVPQKLPNTIYKKFAQIEAEAKVWQQSLQGNKMPDLLIKLSTKIDDIRKAISSSSLIFAAETPKKPRPKEPSRLITPRELKLKLNPKSKPKPNRTPKPSRTEWDRDSSQSVYAYQGGSPGSGRRS